MTTKTENFLWGVFVVMLFGLVIYLLMDGMEKEYVWRVLRYGR